MITNISDSTMLDAEGNATILLAGPIWRDTLTELQNDLHAVKEAGAKKVTLNINSNGGDVTAGLAMYDLIAALDVPTECVVAGMCASAATYPALACDTVRMTKNSTFMVHEPEGGMYGTLQEVEADLEFFRDLRARVFALYGAKTGMGPGEVENLLAAPKFLSAKKALELKFIDAIDGETTEDEGSPDAGSEPEKPAEPEEPASPENAAPQIVDRKTLAATLKDKFMAYLSRDRKEAENAAGDGQGAVNELQGEVDRLAAENAAKDASIDELKNKLAEQTEGLRKMVQQEVANKMASLGMTTDELPAPRKAKMNDKDFSAGLANAYKTGGLEGGARFIQEHS